MHLVLESYSTKAATLRLIFYFFCLCLSTMPYHTVDHRKCTTLIVIHLRVLLSWKENGPKKLSLYRFLQFLLYIQPERDKQRIILRNLGLVFFHT